jgi:hypothetical protein
LSKDIHNFSPLQVLAAAFGKNVATIDVVLWISKICQDTCRLPGIEERVEDERTDARVPLDAVNIVEVVTAKRKSAGAYLWPQSIPYLCTSFDDLSKILVPLGMTVNLNFAWQVPVWRLFRLRMP